MPAIVGGGQGRLWCTRNEPFGADSALVTKKPPVDRLERSSGGGGLDQTATLASAI